MELINMNILSNQAETNHMQVVVEQMLANTVKQADEWSGLSRKAKVEAWGEWMQTPVSLRCFLPFDRVLQVIEEVR